MKKKIIIFSILVLLLLPIRINAYSYKFTNVKQNTLINNNYIKVWPDQTSVPNLYVSDFSHMINSGYFYFHSVLNGSNVYVGHNANIGKVIGTNNSEMDFINKFDTLENNTNNLSNDQRKLLEDLIINGYQFDTTNTKDVTKILSSKDTTLSMMAMQILIWEVMEGGRTDFTTVEPNNIKNSNSYNRSFYKNLVYPNGGETSESGTLYYYYKRIVNSVNAVTDSAYSTAFNTELYPLLWDSTNRKYTATIPGLGKYTSCKSSDGEVLVSTSGTSATISSSKEVDEATITCSYAVGGGTNDDLYYFKFKEIGNCSRSGSCASIIYGSGKKVYTKSFKVTSKSIGIKVKNINIEKNNVDGAIFRFTHRTTTNYSIDIKANTNTKTSINKNGEYIVSEISVPRGYEKISDFNINIDTSTNNIKDCTNKGTDTNGNTTCANGRVVVTSDNDGIVLTIISLEKNFKIIKVNENNDIIKGTTFQILNSKNELMKFKVKDGLFSYDTSGTSDIVLNNSGTYAVSMLPADNYSIVEKTSVNPYRLSSKQDERITKIQIDKTGDLLVYDESQKKYTTAINSTVRIKNYRTLINIVSAQNGSAVQGLSFSIYASDKSTLIKSRLDQEGVYNYLDDQSSSDGVTEYLTDQEGYIHIYDLPVGTYYFKQNNVADASFIKAVIDVTKEGATVNGNKVINTISFSATKNSFSFYKTDEEGNYLGQGSFKLQRYDNTKARYVDLKLSEVENDGTYNEKANIFKEDDNGKRVFSLTNGIATFIDMQSGSEYRIVEVEAPEGYELQSISDTATVTIDDSGNSYGLLVLTNKKAFSQSGQALAQLIVNIDTGQTRIRYAIIIGSIVIIIGVLFVIQRKKK